MNNAQMVRNTRTGQFYIEVRFPTNDKLDLWQNIIEHCAKSLSTNELKTVYDECNKQLLATDPDDIPLNFKEMLKELQQTIVNRHAYCENSCVETQKER